MKVIHVSAKHEMVGVPALPQLVTLFPGAQRVTLAGNPSLLIRHGIDETRLMRNLGLDIPTPILTHYDWEGGTPFEVQKKTAAMMTMNHRGYVLNGMGTGKTKAALWAWRYLNRHGEAGKMLVVAPLSTLNFTWAKEVFQTLPGVKVQVLYGTRQKRLSRLADMDADIYVINHDGLATIAKELEARKDIDTCVVDELAVYRNGTATRTKVVRQAVKRMKWAWGLTGSPTPNAPTDAWGQCTILTPGTVPKYFTAFRNDTMTKITQFKWVAKANSLDTVLAAMSPFVRFTLDDVLELPDMVERVIEVEMGTQQSKVYREMSAAAVTMIQNKEITAMNAGAVLSKLLQISGGYVYSRDRQVHTLDNEARLEALVDVVNSTDQKVIVFVPFVHALQGIAKKLDDEGFDVRTISGATPKGERDTIFQLFQNTGNIKVLVAHPQCMAHGLTLTSAATIVWFLPTADLDIFEQANARIRRIGQKNRQQILMFSGTKAEAKMYAKLRSKQKVQDALLELFEDETTSH